MLTYADVCGRMLTYAELLKASRASRMTAKKIAKALPHLSSSCLRAADQWSNGFLEAWLETATLPPQIADRIRR